MTQIILSCEVIASQISHFAVITTHFERLGGEDEGGRDVSIL
jgi:hypothetical protein